MSALQLTYPNHWEFALPDTLIPSGKYKGVIQELRQDLKAGKIPFEIEIYGPTSEDGIQYPAGYRCGLARRDSNVKLHVDSLVASWYLELNKNSLQPYIDLSKKIVKEIDPNKLQLWHLEFAKQVAPFSVTKYKRISELIARGGFTPRDRKMPIKLNPDSYKISDADINVCRGTPNVVSSLHVSIFESKVFDSNFTISMSFFEQPETSDLLLLEDVLQSV